MGNMNAFENFYSRIRDAKNAYDAAKTEDEKNTARAAYKAVWDELKELGTAACRLFREYETSRNSGNEYLDISEVVWDNEAPGLIAAAEAQETVRIRHQWPNGTRATYDLKLLGYQIMSGTADGFMQLKVSGRQASDVSWSNADAEQGD